MSSLVRHEEFSRSLARIADNDPTLTVVNFNGWGIEDEGAGRLVAALQDNTFVTSLLLRRNGISAALVRLLVGVLENNTSLKVLTLEGNRFGDEGAKALTELLRNSSLRVLVLRNCGIGVEGVRVLAEGLPRNSTLTTLGFDKNNFGDEGTSALAGLLPENSTLTVLNLERNGISDVGACLLVKALLVNFSITAIYFEWNDISQALEQLVRDLARINTNAANPQAALVLKVEWLRSLDDDGLSLLGMEERDVEEEVLRLDTVCQVVWLISSGLDGDKEDAVTLVLDQLNHFIQAEQRRGLFRQLLGVPERGVEVAFSVNETTARTLYRYAVQCGAAPGVLMNLLRAHGSLCTCRDVEHHLIPFMLLATMPEAGVGDVMELLLINPSLVESGISRPNEH